MLLTSIICVPLLAGLLCLAMAAGGAKLLNAVGGMRSAELETRGALSSFRTPHSELRNPRWVFEALNVCAFAIGLVLGIKLLRRVLISPAGVLTEWNEFFRADALSAWMVLLVSVVSLATVVYAIRYFRHDLADGVISEKRVRDFYVLTPLFATGMLLVVLANNLGVMWVAVEATALSSVLLVALYNRKTSLEAAWKYVMLGGLGLVLALFGTILTYAAASGNTGTFGPALSHAMGEGARATVPSFNWSHLLAMAPQLDGRLIKLAFVFAFVGFGTKAGLAPMHSWLPDAHSEAPSPTSAMLSGVSLKIAVYALLRFHILATAALGTSFSRNLLLGFGLFSMLLAGPLILTQTNLKRLLAYSSLEHVGLICVAVGMNAPLTVFGALLHMSYHALTKPVLFFAAGNIHQRYHTLDLRRIGSGLAHSMPGTALVLGLAALAVSGLPPFGLFVSEFTVIAGGFVSEQAWISVVMLAALIIVFCGMLNKLATMVLGAAPEGPLGETHSACSIASMTLPLAALLLFTVWLPAPVRQLMVNAAGIIRGVP